jgi:hypothetical protein
VFRRGRPLTVLLRRADGRVGAVLASLGILADLGRTGLWFFRTQFDPDLSRVAGPAQSYAHVLHDPFGVDGLHTGLRYPGAGRAIAHLTTKAWADHVLGWMHLAVSDPVRSVYLALALTAVLVHLGFLVVGCGYLRAYQPMSTTSTIFFAFGLSLFVQLAYQWFYVGIIDHSMSYTLAYAIALLALAAFFLPAGSRGTSLGTVLAFGCSAIVLVLFTVGKLTPAPPNNACQRSTFEQLRDETSVVVRIPRTCPILTETVGALDDPDYRQAITKLLRRWRIIESNQTLK